MTDKIQQLKKHIQNGNLELARFDQNNKPVKMQISELQEKTSEMNKHQKLYKLLAELSWQQKFEWVNTRRLKGNHLFKTGNATAALQCYLQSLIGLQLKDSDSEKNTQVKQDLQFPILMNMAACFYKLKEYKKGIEICDQVLNDPLGRQFYQALYKKAYFLFEMGSLDKAKQLIFNKDREILLQLSVKLEKNQNQKKVSKNDVKELLTKILYKTKEEKTMYRRIFYQQQDDLASTSESYIEQPVFQYNDNFVKRTFSWLKEALQSCYKAKPKQSVYIDEDENSTLLHTKIK